LFRRAGTLVFSLRRLFRSAGAGLVGARLRAAFALLRTGAGAAYRFFLLLALLSPRGDADGLAGFHRVETRPILFRKTLGVLQLVFLDIHDKVFGAGLKRERFERNSHHLATAQQTATG
jgi:hypothetical protein